MADTIQLRRDTAANWVTANPVLADGEIGIETDTRKRKCGNGTTDWNSLSYMFSDDLDATPTANSHKPVESGGVKAAIDVAILNNGKGAFDISAYKAVDGVLAKFDDLEQALGTNGANVPAAARKPGMSVCFVQSSDNKYVQYRLMANNCSTTVTDWQGVDDEPTAGSDNLVKSGGVRASQQVIEQEIISKQNIDYGKNLFDKNSVELILGKYIGWNHTIIDNDDYAITPYIPIKNGQTLYCNTAYTENVFNAFYDSNKNPIGQVVAGKSITCANNACYVRFSINANNINTCQVEIGSEETSYEPYTRHKHLDELVLKIDGEIEKKALVKSDIRFGKNRYNSFADDIIEGAIINWQGDIVVGDNYNDYMVTGRIPIMEGETLFCNKGFSSTIYSATYDANGKVLDVSASTTRAYVQDAAYVRFSIRLSDRYDITQVEVGTSETDYVPYSEYKYLEQDIANNYITKSIGKNKFNKNSDEIVRGYALGYDGKPFESSDFFITHYIPIKYLDVLYCNSQLTSAVFAVQYDRDYNIIGVNQAKIQHGLHKSAYVRFTCFLTALDSCQVEEGQEFTSYEEYTEFYGNNLDTDSLNKNILWLGTSIPAGMPNTVDINGKTMQNNYPKMVGEILGCPIYNEAVGSSRLKTGSKSEVTQSNPLGWLSGPGQYYAIWVCLMMTIAQKQDLIDNWATYRVTYNWTDSPETLSETNKATILACSYENKVLPYLNGTKQTPDVIVIDHGYNDGVPMTGDEFDEDITSQTDLQTFFGSYNFLINLIRLYLPKVKIIQCCHFVSKNYDNGTFVDFNLVKGQKAIANYNGVPFIPLYDIDGWDSGRLITCNGYWEYDEAHESLKWGTWHNTGGQSRTYTPTTLHCCDTVHPHSDITGETNYELANCIAAWFKGNVYP